MNKCFSWTVSSILLFLIIISNFEIYGDDPEILWTKTYGDSTHVEECYCVRVTMDGGYVFVGRRSLPTGGAKSNVYIVKTNRAGEVDWAKEYDLNIDGFAGHAQGNSIAQTVDGGYIIAGWADTPDKAIDGYLIKTDAWGNRLWHYTYGGNGDDRFNSVQQTDDGGFIAAGHTDSWGTGVSYAYLAKIKPDGTIDWYKYYGGIGSERAYSVQQTQDGGYIFSGTTNSNLAQTIYGYAVYLVKTFDNGNIDWYRTYDFFQDTGDEVGQSVRQTADGGYIVGGWYETASDPGITLLLKTDTTGNVDWVVTYNWNARDVFSEVQQCMGGGYIACGRTNSQGFGNYDVLILKVDNNSNYDWGYIFGGTNYDAVYSVQQTGDGGYILGGKMVDEAANTYMYGIRLGSDLPRGDLNGDGVVNTQDAVVMACFIVETLFAPPLGAGAADLNDNDVVDIMDLMELWLILLR